MLEQNVPQKSEHPQRKLSLKYVFYWLERRLEWILNILNNAALIDIVDRLSKLSILVAAFVFILEAPQRKEQKHLEAWRVIIEMENRSGNGGRIAALENLNQDQVHLNGINLTKAYLANIKLNNAKLQNAEFSGAILYQANFENATLYSANFGCISDSKCTDLKEANFKNANLTKATLRGDFTGTIFENANLCQADFKEIDAGLTVEQIKQAKNWQFAFYSEDLTQQLGLTNQANSNYNKDSCPE